MDGNDGTKEGDYPTDPVANAMVGGANGANGAVSEIRFVCVCIWWKLGNSPILLVVRVCVWASQGERI